MVRGRTSRGAAAVEFALVSTVLMLIVFGILQYGFYFNDALAGNEAVRAATRAAVVERSGNTQCTGTFGWSVIRCATDGLIDRDGSAVRISAPSGWVQGAPLVVCAWIPSRSGFGLLPMPHGGRVRVKLQMSIEETGVIPSGTGLSDSAPSGQDWSWC